jgi:thiamine kinase-like enzyme
MHRISLAQETVVLFSPGWQDRLARLQSVANAATLAANSRISALAAQHDSVFRTLRSTGYFEEAVQWVRTQAVQRRPACWIVRDAHQENWLFESDNLSGVVDFGAARCDWPAWDLIRLWSSAGVSGEQRAAFVGIYLAGLNESASRHIEALSKSVESLVNDESWHRLDYLQNLLSAWQWRTWSVEERDWSTTEIQRWQMLLQRLG